MPAACYGKTHTDMRQITRRESLGLMSGSLLCAASGAPGAEPPGDGLVRYVHDETYEVTHEAQVTIGDLRPKAIEIWLPVPVDHPEQTVSDLQIVPRLPVRSDATGLVSVAGFYKTARLPEPGQQLTITMTYRLTSRAIEVDQQRLQRASFGPYRKNRDYRTHTRAEQKIEVADSAISRQARKLQTRTQNPLEFARSAYDWVVEQTEYQLIDGIGGARYCLDEGHGECGDYSALFVALCRAAGIPARPVVGFWAGKTNGWHVWAEFMLPTGDWLPVDPSIGDQSDRNYRRSFLSRDNRLGVLAKSFDVSFPKKRRGQNSVHILQSGAWWWSVDASRRGRRPTQATFEISGNRVG